MIIKIILGIIGIFVLLVVIGAIAGSGKKGTPSTTPTTQTTSPTETPTAQAVKVNAKDLVAEFDKNKLAAEDKYKGKYVEFAAKVKNISEDVLGTPYLALEPPTDDKYYFGTTLKCDFKNKDELKSLENGKVITLRGTVVGMSLGIISLKDCQVIQ